MHPRAAKVEPGSRGSVALTTRSPSSIVATLYFCFPGVAVAGASVVRNGFQNFSRSSLSCAFRLCDPGVRGSSRDVGLVPTRHPDGTMRSEIGQSLRLCRRPEFRASLILQSGSSSLGLAGTILEPNDAFECKHDRPAASGPGQHLAHSGTSDRVASGRPGRRSRAEGQRGNQ